MSRIAPLDPVTADGKTRDTLGAVNRMLGVTPNLFRVAARSPSVLEALVGLNGAVARGSLRAPTREAIALTVAELNGCDYCLSAHTVLGGGAGLTETDIVQARDATSRDPRQAATLRLAKEIVVQHGQVSDEALASARRAGLDDADLLEVVANVVLNVFTNYVNLVAQTEIDFPKVRAASSQSR